ITSRNEWKLLDFKDKVKKILDTTSLKDTQIIDLRIKEDYIKLKKKIIELHSLFGGLSNKINGITKILIDHAFPVKGIGTVILGIVKEGKISTGQMLELTGYNGPSKKVIIRSIQKHDRDFKTAIKGDRVGLALKGNISAEDISRDNILINPGLLKSEHQIKARVFINQFYKPKDNVVKPGNGIQYNSLVDLKSTPFKFTSGDEILPGSSGIVNMKFDKLFYHNGSGLKGIITDFNRFDNKLRIVGYFNQLLN
ncbi:MAG: EF-Tu/IF-2/RF-3 family GTPase, partial [Candidatus Thorarchaeota archaeon]